MMKLFIIDLVTVILEMVVAASIMYDVVTLSASEYPALLAMSVVALVIWVALLFSTLVTMSYHLED